MASAPPADSPARVAFQLERLEAGADGLLEVEGTWSGVRGMRFVRPALVIRDGAHQRTLLATLEHKPWAPDSRPWRASFPWDGGELDPERAELAVAPSVIVPLAGAAAALLLITQSFVLSGAIAEDVSAAALREELAHVLDAALSS
jgi:hypothetical protein